MKPILPGCPKNAHSLFLRYSDQSGVKNKVIILECDIVEEYIRQLAFMVTASVGTNCGGISSGG